jgi:hypothetical protein
VYRYAVYRSSAIYYSLIKEIFGVLQKNGVRVAVAM